MVCNRRPHPNCFLIAQESTQEYPAWTMRNYIRTVLKAFFWRVRFLLDSQSLSCRKCAFLVRVGARKKAAAGRKRVWLGKTLPDGKVVISGVQAPSLIGTLADNGGGEPTLFCCYHCSISSFLVLRSPDFRRHSRLAQTSLIMNCKTLLNILNITSGVW